jgi:small subunit ribosomal protein S16
MSVKIRLARHGKKHQPYYHIVVADSRAPRDGRFIEVIGKYNPNSTPAFIELDNEKALEWLQKGAQPTDTTKAILSYKGILYRKHLQRGVAKGLLTQEAADAKFEQWLNTKNEKIAEKRKSYISTLSKVQQERLEAETKKKEAIAERVRAKNTPPPAEEAAAEEAPAAEATPEVTGEAAAPEAPAAE